MARTLYFARINRRRDQDFSSEEWPDREFRDDLEVLQGLAPLRAKPAGQPNREWIAADLEWVGPDESMLIGFLGLVDEHTRRDFDEENGSWVKGRQWEAGGARDEAVVPFAIDAAPDSRYLCHASSGSLTHQQFLSGLKIVVNKAVGEHGLWPVDWDIDPVTLTVDVEDWLADHPRVRLLQRTVRRSNPGDDLDDVRRKMEALKAGRASDEFAARYGGSLRLTDENGSLTEMASELLHGLESGDLDVKIEARRDSEDEKPTYSSRDRPHRVSVEEWSDDRAGLSQVTDSLRAFVARMFG